MVFGRVVLAWLLLVQVLTTVEVTAGAASNAWEDEDSDHWMHPQSFLFREGNPSTTMTKTRQKRFSAKMPEVRFQPVDIERHPDYWNNVAQTILGRQLDKNQLNTKVAKNVILFMGDGLSIPTLAATRVFLGDESTELSFEKFPYVGLSKTYCTNVQVADSACTATAVLAGVKANYGTIGLSAAAALGDCYAQNNTDNHVQSIAKWAQDYGMATGFVTNTQVTNASPAGVYANTANRNWENDDNVRQSGFDPSVCPDIATQLVHGDVGRHLKVILGGGRRQFYPNTSTDSEGVPGRRTDGMDLIKHWLHHKRSHQQNHGGGRASYVQNRDQLLEVDEDTEYLLGLFHANHVPFHMDADAKVIPTLEEMVGKAMDVLERDSHHRGYFLFVEGGRIDHGHHTSQPAKAFDETVEFAKAIDLARRRTSLEDTLIVVTSDHSHTMTMSGYSSRGNDILGINDSQQGLDSLPYATISYANGPGYERNLDRDGRRNLNQVDMHQEDYKFPSTVPLGLETHGGDDVAVFASGPWAHLFSGTYEQNFIPHGMAYAACIGFGRTACGDQ
ncbi:alkaline phosphatase [Aedes aegypti]|uniref:Alkaline phosphatase n=1 Tax=Aedes aegypti TaxID=7159 RepID=A0A1S4F5Z7_AEDAE|nr:alkaline phosphatase [Aedes aegypti]XP_021693223.1 alkaline phosphatase [Aedes aegypti]XP_021693224.1 alkaline phosphatase [Aedes aegypti]XP_021693225.1 alkaline phosphatase [Aedes aegypti]XP_021693226.1 alkaline phosphatase [Aedes aegypti]